MVGGGGRSSRPLDKMGPGLPKIIFRPFGEFRETFIRTKTANRKERFRVRGRIY